ncbi:PREDICTED: collagen alpha-1(II) chain [Chinchilla lanigera]|uniref:collagen alpha-1(II) chain n=1 Tax=Chinchilla lanigera TaxID=34839 RepID=UPI00069672C9|nr:PREDICTED: collagen alpha-1(II) chain [Chinchilla lanigera]
MPGFTGCHRTSPVQSTTPPTAGSVPAQRSQAGPRLSIILADTDQIQLKEAVRPPVRVQDRGREGVGPPALPHPPPAPAHWSDTARGNWGGREATGGRRLQRDCAPVSHNLYPGPQGSPAGRLNRAGWRQGSERCGSGGEARVGSNSAAGVSPSVETRPVASPAGHPPRPHKSPSPAAAQSLPSKLSARRRLAPGHSQARRSLGPRAALAERTRRPRHLGSRHPRQPHVGRRRGRGRSEDPPGEAPQCPGPCKRLQSQRTDGQAQDRSPSRAGRLRLTWSFRETRRARTARSGPEPQAAPLRRPARPPRRGRGGCASPPPVCGARAIAGSDRPLHTRVSAPHLARTPGCADRRRTWECAPTTRALGPGGLHAQIGYADGSVTRGQCRLELSLGTRPQGTPRLPHSRTWETCASQRRKQTIEKWLGAETGCQCLVKGRLATPAPDAAKIRSVAGGGRGVWGQPARGRPGRRRRCAHRPGPERRVAGAGGGHGPASDGARGSRRRRVPPGASCEARRGSGRPALARHKAASLPPSRAPRGLCSGSTHQLPPPGFRSGTSAARASRLARPPASLSSARSLPVERGDPGGDREPSRRPGWGAGPSGRASGRGRRRAPPLLSGTCQCFALGAGTRLGVLP